MKWLCWKQLCLFCMLGILLFSVPEICYAAGQKQPPVAAVYDDGAALLEEEADWIKGIAKKFSEKSGWNIIVASCADAAGRKAETVCQEYFNDCTNGDDGISLLIDLDNREVYLATAGSAISYLDDERLGRILDEASAAAKQEDYAQCFFLMLSGAERAYDAGPVEQNKIFFVILAAVLVLIVTVLRSFFGRPPSDTSTGGTYRRRYRRYGPAPAGRSGAGRARTGAGGRRFGGGGRKF